MPYYDETIVHAARLLSYFGQVNLSLYINAAKAFNYIQRHFFLELYAKSVLDMARPFHFNVSLLPSFLEAYVRNSIKSIH